MTDEQRKVIVNSDSERLNDEELRDVAWILNQLTDNE